MEPTCKERHRWGTVSVTDHVALVACTPLALVLSSLFQCGVASANVVALGHLVRLSRCAR